jgi:4-hydroxy-3-methylbut-2-en-1-yl diphosphate synthase IspG/GcpE
MEAACMWKGADHTGNYADRKLAAPRDYTDAEYASELDSCARRFPRLILRCKEWEGRSASAVNTARFRPRMNATRLPGGHVRERAGVLRICEALDFHDIVVSLKRRTRASCWRRRDLSRAPRRGRFELPLNLGVTEAGVGILLSRQEAIFISPLLFPPLHTFNHISNPIPFSEYPSLS